MQDMQLVDEPPRGGRLRKIVDLDELKRVLAEHPDKFVVVDGLNPKDANTLAAQVARLGFRTSNTKSEQTDPQGNILRTLAVSVKHAE